MQIAAVGADLCARLQGYRVRVAAVVGGMSVQKQRRVLGGGKEGCAHVVVATPGRLCELCDEGAEGALADLSRVRFLVVDEADRVVEEGHFPEARRIFARIRDHEDLAAQGRTPAQAARERAEGKPCVEEEEEEGEEEKGEERGVPLPASHRQTLLFSATMRSEQACRRRGKRALAGAAADLPAHIQQLLLEVGRGDRVEVADASAPATGPGAEGPSLPASLRQLELRVTAQDKDLALYYFLLHDQGRTLLFVNSIKSARRVDGLLRALGLNSRAIHAQMQQRQRLRALDSFKAAPIGATCLPHRFGVLSVRRGACGDGRGGARTGRASGAARAPLRRRALAAGVRAQVRAIG